MPKTIDITKIIGDNNILLSIRVVRLAFKL